MKIRPVRPGLFHADGQTDRYVKLIVVFHNFVNVPKKVHILFSAHFSISFAGFAVIT
jgi:hypothetical protein